jgi:hypothetical protein
VKYVEEEPFRSKKNGKERKLSGESKAKSLLLERGKSEKVKELKKQKKKKYVEVDSSDSEEEEFEDEDEIHAKKVK